MTWRNGFPTALRVRRLGLTTALVSGGLLAGAVAGAAGAAGGSGGESGGATAAQTAQAKKALLVLSDLPAGWTSSASTTAGGAGFTGAPQLARCIGVPTQLIKSLPPEVNSLQFSDQGGAEQVQDTISIYPSPSYASEEYTAVASKKTPRCLSALFNGSSGSDGGGGGDGAGGVGGAAATVTRVSSPKGTRAFAIEIAGSSGSSAGGSQEASSAATRTETVFLVHGQYGDSISIVTSGSQTVPSSLVDHLASVAEGRL
jgi:hypothetical protein